MATPQSIVRPPARVALFLTTVMTDGRQEVVRGLLEDVAAVTRSVGFRAPDAGLTCVVGIGSDAWDHLFTGQPRPKDLHPFPALDGARHHAPATPGDLLFHLRARRMDLCFEAARLILDRLGDAVTVVDEVHGFKYFDERDLLGFVDGSENPEGDAATAAVHIGDEDPGFRGGSYVIVQKYLHDLATWDALPTQEQERVIGRRKLSNLEFPDDEKAANAHIELNTVIDDNGVQQQILRDNMPFGEVGRGEFGTYFIGYSRTPAVTEEMLRKMFLGDPPGNTDRILDFSTPVTGCLFFVPSEDFLQGTPAPETPTPEDTAPGAAEGGSLGIGSLKGA